MSSSISWYAYIVSYTNVQLIPDKYIGIIIAKFTYGFIVKLPIIIPELKAIPKTIWG